jgi:hypothetical protein
MTTLKEKIRFSEQYIINKEGRKFSMVGREWVRDNIFLPVDGFKLWMKEGTDPCPTCRESLNSVIENPYDNQTKDCQCGGLVAEPIIVTVINVARQEGKTFSSMAYALSTMLLNKNKSFALLCATEDQCETLISECYSEAICRSPKLESLCDVQRLKITAKKTGSIFEGLSTSHKSVTGRSRTHLLIDEARDIPARTAVALIPAIFAMKGVECPASHVQLTEEQAEKAPKKCSVCGERLVPWQGRILITSSSGIMDDSENDWFAELVESLTVNPHPNYFLYKSEESLNPSKSKKTIGAIEDVFGSLSSTKHYISSEISNKFSRKGEDFLSRSDLKRCIDKDLVNIDGTNEASVAFLDTSVNVDKTSLVILSDDVDKGGKLFEFVDESRLDYWQPRGGHPINPDDILYRLDAVMPAYTNLKAFCVDTRGMPWAQELVLTIRKSNRPWRNKIKPWGERKSYDSQAGWSALQQRILASPPKIRLQHDIAQNKEFDGLRIKMDSTRGGVFVADRDRRISHKDITESLACACYMISVEIMHTGLRLSDVSRRDGLGRGVVSSGRRLEPKGFRENRNDGASYFRGLDISKL